MSNDTTPPLQSIAINVADIVGGSEPIIRSIPNHAPPLGPYPGLLSGERNVRGISGVLLDPPTDQHVYTGSLPGTFVSIIPPEYSNRSYVPVLRDAASLVIPHDPQIWKVTDSANGVITFGSRTPAQLGYTLPLTVDYWRYVGPYSLGGVVEFENIGSGTGQIWHSTVSGIAYLRTLIPDNALGSEGIIISTVGDNILIGNTLYGQNVGAATHQVYINKAVTGLRYRSLIAGSDIALTTVGANITIESTLVVPLTALNNVGTGTNVWIPPTTGGVANIRRVNISAGITDGGVTVTTAGQTVLVGNTLNGQNITGGGPSVGVSIPRVLDTLPFKSLLAGADITLTQSGDDVIIAFNPVYTLTAITNVGGGLVATTTVGTVVSVRTMIFAVLPANTGVTISFTTDTVVVGMTLVGNNPSTTVGSVGISMSKNGSSLNFYSLIGGGDIIIAAGGNNATITLTIAVSAFQDATGNTIGIATYAGMAGTVATIRSIGTSIATSTGIQVTQIDQSIAVGNTLTCANLGIGAGTPFDQRNDTILQFNTLAADGGAVVSSPASNVITISNSMNATSLGSGSALAVPKTLAVMGFNRIVGSTNGMTVSAPVGNTITLSNTLTGANLGIGTGLIWFDKLLDRIRINTLVGSLTGVTIGSPVSDLITITNDVVGENPSTTVGAVPMYLNKSLSQPPRLSIRSLVGSNGVVITSGSPTANDILITITLPTGTPADNFADGSVSNTEYQFLDTVTSSVQTQINSKVDPPTGAQGSVVVLSATGVSISGTFTVALLASNSSAPIIGTGGTLVKMTTSMGPAGSNPSLGGTATNSVMMSTEDVRVSGTGSAPALNDGNCAVMLCTSSGGSGATTGPATLVGNRVVMIGGKNVVSTNADSDLGFVCGTTNNDFPVGNSTGRQVTMGITENAQNEIGSCNIVGFGSSPTRAVIVRGTNTGNMFCSMGTFAGTGGQGARVESTAVNAAVMCVFGVTTLTGASVSGTNAWMAAVTPIATNIRTNAAVIGGSASLAGAANNSLTSRLVYAGTTLLTCDAAKKRDMVVDLADEGLPSFTERIMATHAYRYRWDHDDANARPTRGLHAGELRAAFPTMQAVKDTWREVTAVQKDSNGVWRGTMLGDGSPGVAYPDHEVSDAGRLSGQSFACGDRPLDHSVVDVTAMFALLWSMHRHAQGQVTGLMNNVDDLTEKIDRAVRRIAERAA